jgi:anthranilate 1,2-dioxygenase large subunit
VRDPNHGGLLHMFQIAFGIARLGARGGAMLDAEGKHNMSWGEQAFSTEDKTNDQDGYADTGRGDMDITLRDPSIIPYRKEYPDNLSITITTTFPNCTFQQIGNTLAVRHFRTHGPGECEIYSTFYGFEDDDAETTRDRLRKANLAGPAGLVSMEDGEAVELVHRAVMHDKQAHSVVEFGGRGPAISQESMVTDVPVRGFWIHYCKLMGINPGEAH